VATNGKTGIGGSTNTWNECWAMMITMSEAGTLDDLKVYGKGWRDVRLAIYNDDGSAPGSTPAGASLVEDLGTVTYASNTPTWKTLASGSNPSLTNGNNYWLMAKSDTAQATAYYDSSGSDFGAGAYQSASRDPAAAYADPDAQSWSTTAWEVSLHAVYTAAAAAGGDGRPQPRGVERGVLRGVL